MSILSLHLFNLYLLHSLHTNRRGGGLNIFYLVILFSSHPAYIFTHFAFLCMYWVCHQLSLFLVRLVGKKILSSFILWGKGVGYEGRRSVLKIISVFICLSIMSLCLYVCLCLSVLFSFDFVWFVDALSSRIDLVFTCSQSFCSSSKVKAPTNLSSVIVA